MEPVFLDLNDVLEVHRHQIEMYGGAHGLRDRRLFDIRASNSEFEEIVNGDNCRLGEME